MLTCLATDGPEAHLWKRWKSLLEDEVFLSLMVENRLLIYSTFRVRLSISQMGRV